MIAWAGPKPKLHVLPIAHADRTQRDTQSSIVPNANWEGCRAELRERLGRPPDAADVPDIMCGPVFEDLPADHQEKTSALNEAEETSLFYKMVEDILTLEGITDEPQNGNREPRAQAGSRKGYQNEYSRTADFGRPEKIFAASDTCLNIFL